MVFGGGPAEGHMTRFAIVFFTIVAVGVVAFLYFYFSTTEVVENQPPEIPRFPEERLDPSLFSRTPTAKPYKVPNAASVQKFVGDKIKLAGYPVHLESVEFQKSRDPGDKIERFLQRVVLPDVHGRAFRRFIDFSRHCEAHEACGVQDVGPSQLGWTEENVNDYKSRIDSLLREDIKVEDSDLIFLVRWVTDTNESFTTILLTRADSTPKFETILFFSTPEKNCGETANKSGPQESSLTWDGKALNGFGIPVVTWKGTIVWRYQNGKFQDKDLCPKTCLSWTNKFFWEVDGDETKATTQATPNAQPEEVKLLYQVVWSLWWPTKINAGDKGGVEMSKPNGNMVSGSYSIRADGSFNKNE